jgi:peptidoglycan/xylan/chitin deacetylase (PgdA/CDA1 family)
MKALRLAIISSVPPAQLHHLLRRILSDLPEVRIAGVFQLPLIPNEGIGKELLKEVGQLRHRFRAARSAACHRVLRWFHAAENPTNPNIVSLCELKNFCVANDIPCQVRDNLPKISEVSKAFEVHGPAADLTLFYGEFDSAYMAFVTRTQRCVTLRQNVTMLSPAIGNGLSMNRIQIHRVLSDGKLGEALSQRAWAVEPFDTPVSIELKARLLGIDCLIEVIRTEGAGTGLLVQSITTNHRASGNGLNGSSPSRHLAVAARQRFKPNFGRPWYKLAVRLLAYPALRIRNRRFARLKRFPIVILFHHVITDRPKSLGISTEQFLNHVRFLKKHYRIASLPEAIEMLHKEEVPQPTVVLTFDDGYQDNFLCLRAVAEAENVPITLFVCTKKVEEQAAFQHDLDRGELTFPALSWDQVRFLDRHQVTIGSHTQTHLDCACTDEEVLRREIVGSLEDLRRELGHEVPFFSFPKGKPQNMSTPARAIAGRVYPYLFSAHGGVNHAPLTRATILKRCDHPDSLLELELLLQSVLNRADRVSTISEEKSS